MVLCKSRSGATYAIAIAIAVACASASSSRAADGVNALFFDDVRVFDGVRMRERADVLIRDGRIAAIGANLKMPADAERIDGAGKTLLPGLIDAHTHSWGDAQRDALRFGVTTELDMMGDRTRLPALKTQRASIAPTDEADVWSAGAAVTAPKGHGTQYGMGVPTLAPGEDAAAFVKARVEEGSDYIKIILEDFSAHSETMRLPTVTEAQTRDAIAAAHAEGKRAVVHVSRMRDAHYAVSNGADGLVHMFVEPGDAAFVETAKSRKAFVVPTLSVIATMARAEEGRKLAEEARLSPWLTRAQIDALKATYGDGAPRPAVLTDAMNNVRALRDAGVDILAGTDAGNPGTAHGVSMHGELELLVRAGLTPTQALAAATSVPARRFALDDRGRIAPGLRADVLLVDGDPSQEIRATRAIVGVWKNGYAVARPRQDAQAEAPRGEALPASAKLIDDFEATATAGANGLLPAKFGSGWTPTTDQMAGGASVGKIDRANGALAVSGEIKTGFAFPWSGAMYFPASAPMQPVDLSGRTELVFKARGDGRSYSVMLFSGAQMQPMPSMKTFVAGPEWKEVRLPLANFSGADLVRVRGFAFTAGQPAGVFAFEIDDIEVK
ncbi:MAG: CIA30 family protein [Xanthomonadaceae bacterium]|nr:CIA30 family protein [Xanthomonadaceae bacterium]